MPTEHNKPHDCAEHGCLAAMLGLAESDADVQ